MYKGNTMRKLFLILSIILISTTANARDEETGTVDHVTTVSNNGETYFYLVVEDRPTSNCGGSVSQWTIKNDDSEVSKRQYAMVLAAASTGTLLTVKGFETCQPAIYGESVDEIKYRK